MAFRIDKAAVRGELCNEERGVVTGRIWLAGRKDPLRLRLRGDCLRDLAGCTVRFTNPRPAPDPTLDVLVQEQNGVTGEITASRKVRQPVVSEQDLLDLVEKEQPIPYRVANCLYLEWYSEENGRVVIETADFKVGVSTPAWTMSAEENDQQLAASEAHFHRFLNAITGDLPDSAETIEQENSGADADDDDADSDGIEDGLLESALSALNGSESAPDDDEDDDGDDDDLESAGMTQLNEFEWEQELRDADRRAEAYQEALEKYHDHPQREMMIAAALGWDDEPEEDDDDEEDETSSAPGRDPQFEDPISSFDPSEPGGAWPDDADPDGESYDEEFFGASRHPLSHRAQEFAHALQREAEEHGLVGDTLDVRDNNQVLSLIFHVFTVRRKLAGALDRWAHGIDPEPGFIIAMLKRAQVPLNEALHAFDCVDTASLNAETRQWLRSRKRDLFDLRREIVDLMHQLRTS